MTETMAQKSDELIRKAQKGDNKAFQELVLLYDSKVLNLAFKMLGNRQDAEDIYQEVFMRVYHHIKNFRFESAFETWLYRIVVNTAINYRKMRNKYLNRTWVPENYDDEAPWTPLDDQPLPDELTMNQEIQTQIQAAMENLTFIQRSVFVLKFYQDFKIREIAEIVNCSEGTIKNTLFRASQKMRRSLIQYIRE